MDANTVLLITAISSAVSGTVSFALKSYLENRIKNTFEREVEDIRHRYNKELEDIRHQFDMELQKLQADLDLKADISKEVIERRFKEYPLLVELIYRTRNMARDISNSRQISASLVSEFAARSHELEDCLYKYRLDLERDGVFHKLHNYKNLLINCCMLFKDLSFYLERNDEPRIREYNQRIQGEYAAIESAHQPIIEALSKIDQDEVLKANEPSTAH